MRLVGDGGAVVGGEEEEETGYLVGEDVTLEALDGEEVLLVVGGHVEATLLFGEDGSGEDGVDADVGGAELMRERSSHGDNGGLGHVVDGEAGGGDEPGDGAHVDDGARACRLHSRGDGLRGEELVPEIHGHALVPVLGGDFGEAVAVVAGCVVDEDLRGAEDSGDLSDGRLEGGDVGEIAVDVQRGVGNARREVVDEGECRLIGEIEKGYTGALEGEDLYGGGSDALCASADEDHFSGEARVAGEDRGRGHKGRDF
ncbi:MAG: hypothetical protein JWQ42_2459 [Edaphobacter sp.]|nr:hypothetical protein [Edaphobacter sp.]